jgi:peptidoglycan/LPS O-acetylase OafA/YrhL
MPITDSRPAGDAAGAGARVGHLAQLDGLRAFAVLGVLVSHYMHETPRLGTLGSWGVRLFFVLSGYLITAILLDCRRAIDAGQGVALTLRQFYARRFLRIFPLYYAAIAGAWLAGVAEARTHLWWHLAYLSNVLFARTQAWHHPFSHFWSLAVEEQFYLVWPPVILLLPRRLLVPAIGLAVAAAPAWRWAFAGHVPDMWLWNLPVNSLDALGVGALLAVATAAWPPLRRFAEGRWLVVVLCPLLYLVASGPLGGVRRLAWLPRLDLGPLYDTAVAVAAAGIILGAVRGWRGPVGALLAARPVAYVGRISYGVYVLHLFTSLVVPWALGRVGIAFPAAESWPRTLALTAATVAWAAVSWHAFEGPINALKRRFPYVLPRAGAGDLDRRLPARSGAPRAAGPREPAVVERQA